MQSRFLTDEELAALRQTMPPVKWLPLQVAQETGLRIGDVIKLSCGDVVGRRLFFTAQKTGKSGVAQLSSRTARELAMQTVRARMAGSPWLFPSPVDKNKHITRQAIWKRVKKAADRAHVEARGASPHSMRKVYGVREYRQHGIKAAREGLQHSDIRTTEIYALADWLSGENAKQPLLREDMGRIIRYICDWLGLPTDINKK